MSDASQDLEGLLRRITSWVGDASSDLSALVHPHTSTLTGANKDMVDQVLESLAKAAKDLREARQLASKAAKDLREAQQLARIS